MLALSWEEKWNFLCADIKDDGQPADLAILLGSAPEIATERARAAAQLYHTGRVKYILASGGVTWECGGKEISEADLMAQILVEKGVPEQAILLDNDSRTTLQNMICSTLTITKTVKLSNISSVIIVTSLSHMKRSLALAEALLPRKFQISAYPSDRQPKDQWLASEENRSRLDWCISAIKFLVDKQIIADMDI